MGITLWFTGLSGSGKSTIANAVSRELKGIKHYCLDGDILRDGINSDLGFTELDRTENIRRSGEIAKLFNDSGCIVLATFISPLVKDREQVRRIHEQACLNYIEVYVDCPLKEAEARDPKGLYKKARQGLIPDFTGIDSPYDIPVTADLHFRTDLQDLEEITNTILEVISVIPTT